MRNKEYSNKGILNSLELFAWSARELPIRFLGDEMLQTACIPVEKQEFGSEAVTEIAKCLTAVLIKYRERTGMGRGLAANQIGHNKRMIAVWFDQEPEVICNPHVVSEEGHGSYWESCLSSGTLLVGEVNRSWKAKFSYNDMKGRQHELDADEKQTRVLLHEIDHLDGITCNEKYEPNTLKFVSGGEQEIFGFPLKRID